ncbi:MAG: hypothetical protein OQL21_01755, partial [Gammaproteobacteria bacterium]|nr:hypothetical protein [Gammaproteobacteria bacterium]
VYIPNLPTPHISAGLRRKIVPQGSNVLPRGERLCVFALKKPFSPSKPSCGGVGLLQLGGGFVAAHR